MYILPIIIDYEKYQGEIDGYHIAKESNDGRGHKVKLYNACAPQSWLEK